MQLRDHMDIIINGEIIMDSKYDVGMVLVRIQLRRMQHEQKLYGIVVIIINDTIELILLHEMITGQEIYTMIIYGEVLRIQLRLGNDHVQTDIMCQVRENWIICMRID